MSGLKDGGPAFPKLTGPGFSGMTLRDYFAAQLAAGDAAKESALQVAQSDGYYLKRARFYYKMADAMLHARGEDAVWSANNVDNNS